MDGRDFGLGGGEAVRGVGDKERLEADAKLLSPVGEVGTDDVGNGVLPFRPGGGELGGA